MPYCCVIPTPKLQGNMMDISPKNPASTNPSTLPAPNNPPNPPRRNSWNIVNEMGDGACGFRAISRRTHHGPNKHVQLRQEILQHIHENRNDPDLQHVITLEINREYLYILGEYPQSTRPTTITFKSCHTHMSSCENLNFTQQNKDIYTN